MSANKYQREIVDINDPSKSVLCDVYTVIDAFAVTCPARQHAIKKLLCSGLRGKGDALQDLHEAGQANQRAVELEVSRMARSPVPMPAPLPWQ